MAVVAPSAASSIHRRVRPAFFAGLFTDFLAAFLAAIFFAGVFLATVFLTAFFTGAFLAALLTSAFFVVGFGASLAGVNALVTVATAEPKAVFTEPATSSAIAKPYPTFSAAFSTIVFSAIFRVPSRYSFAATHCSGLPTQSYKSFSFPNIVGFWVLGRFRSPATNSFHPASLR